MRAPRFWGNPPDRPGLRARLLAPLAWLWTAVTRRRLAAGRGRASGCRSICVGNLTVGGAGKTPTVVALALRLAARGVAAHVVSRGHGGRLAGPVRVDPARHRAADVGDEPLLLAAFGPVWVGRDRVAAARAAVADGAGAIVMDDGFQNPDLAKDLSIVVVDAGYGFGNGRVMPAGPLREPVGGRAGAGRPRAGDRSAGSAAAVRGCLAGGAAARRGRARPARHRHGLAGAPRRRLRRDRPAGEILRDAARRGRGNRRRARLRDHAPFDPRILARLDAEAKAARAQLVTTEKDAVRLPAAFRPKVLVLPVRLDLADWAPVDEALDRIGLG